MGSSLMRRDIHYMQGIETEEAVEIVRHCFFSDEEMQTNERIVRSMEEFQKQYREMLNYWRYERCLAELYSESKNTVFKYYGKCEVCNSIQALVVDYQGAEEQNGIKIPNWRERLTCPNCGCNNRQRFIAHEIFQRYEPGMRILMHEQKTHIFGQLQKELPTLEGFEYMGKGYVPGAYYDGVRFEDPCSCTYADEEFDIVLSSDVLELVSDYRAAFREISRILRPGGKFTFTVPFNANSQETEIRAHIQGDATEFHGDPLYYPNPIEGYKPLPVYQIFGWDILEDLKECGFRDAWGKVYYGIKEGYLGYLPIYFEAQK